MSGSEKERSSTETSKRGVIEDTHGLPSASTETADEPPAKKQKHPQSASVEAGSTNIENVANLSYYNFFNRSEDAPPAFEQFLDHPRVYVQQIRHEEASDICTILFRWCQPGSKSLVLESSAFFEANVSALKEENGAHDFDLWHAVLLELSGEFPLKYNRLGKELAKAIATPRNFGLISDTLGSTLVSLFAEVGSQVNSARGITLTHRKGGIKLLLKYFLKLGDDLIRPALETKVFSFAQDCLWVYKLTERNIANSYIDRYMNDTLARLDEKSNLDSEMIAEIKSKLSAERQNIRFLGGKNKALIDFLEGDGTAVRLVNGFEYAQFYCEEKLPSVKTSIEQLLCENSSDSVSTLDLSWGGVKTWARMKQKYEEYATEYLQSGKHVFRKFKDLFRLSIAFKDFVKVNTAALPIAQVNYREVGNYRACYVILEIDTLNVELKVVKSLQADTNSHLWYELKRHNSVDNVILFIKNHLREFDTVQ